MRRQPSPLGDIQPDGWRAESTTDFLDLPNVLGRLVALEPAQADLPARVRERSLRTRQPLIEPGRGPPARAAQKFAPVPPAVWEFHIGGHQVMEKSLKDRRGRALSLDEITNVENVANVLVFTIDQMAKINEAYRTAFPDRG